MTSTATLRPLIVTEVRLHRRHGVLAATLSMTAVWVAVLLSLPSGWRAQAVPWVLFLDLATLGFFFVPALSVVERSHGITAALRLTRLSPAVALAVRLGTFAISALFAATFVLLPSGLGWAPDILAGVLLTNTLVSLIAVLMVGRATTLTVYMARVPAVAVPLILPALVRGIGLWDAPVLALSPMTGALDLLAGRWSWTTAGWIVLWLAAMGVAAVRIGFDVNPSRQTSPARRSASTAGLPAGYSRWSAIRSLARVDRRTLLDDRMLLLLLAGVAVIPVSIRWVGGPGLAWVEGRYGVDLSAHLPLLWAFVLVVHTPTIFGAVTGLLFLEDRDAGLFPAITTTRSSLMTLLAYRLTATAAITGTMVAIALPVAGAHHSTGIGGTIATCLVAGAVSVVPALLLATLAHDRVQGMALTKAMGVPLYLPLAWWFIDGPAGWLFAPIPTAWAARTFWATTAMETLGFATGGIVLSLALLTAMTWRLRRSNLT